MEIVGQKVRFIFLTPRDLRERLGRDVPINILTVREATTEEIELMKWHNEMVAKHQQQ